MSLWTNERLVIKQSEIRKSCMGVRWISRFLIIGLATRVIEAQWHRNRRSLVLGFLSLEIMMFGTSRVLILAFRDLQFRQLGVRRFELSGLANLDMRLRHPSDLAVWHSPDLGVHRFTVLRLIDSNVHRFELLWSYNTLFC